MRVPVKSEVHLLYLHVFSVVLKLYSDARIGEFNLFALKLRAKEAKLVCKRRDAKYAHIEEERRDDNKPKDDLPPVGSHVCPDTDLVLHPVFWEFYGI